MKNINEIAFIIPARINSTRIIKKMIRPFGNTNLFEICINKLTNCNIPKSNLYIAIGDEELITICKNKFPDINIFYRTDKSINSNGLIPNEIFEWVFDLSKKYKYYFIINPCQPFLNIKTINNFIKTFLKSENKSLISAIKFKDFFWNENFELDKDKFMTNDFKNFIFNTRFVKQTYKASHGLQIGVMKELKKNYWMGSFKKGDPELFFVEEEESFDIDYPWQFEMAELKYINQNKD